MAVFSINRNSERGGRPDHDDDDEQSSKDVFEPGGQAVVQRERGGVQAQRLGGELDEVHDEHGQGKDDIEEDGVEAHLQRRGRPLLDGHSVQRHV